MSEEDRGMGISGFTLRVSPAVVPSGITFKKEYSTMRSTPTCTPVVSRSKKAIGRFRFSLIVSAIVVINANIGKKAGSLGPPGSAFLPFYAAANGFRTGRIGFASFQQGRNGIFDIPRLVRIGIFRVVINRSHVAHDVSFGGFLEQKYMRGTQRSVGFGYLLVRVK